VVAALLDDNIQDLAFVVHGAPEIHPLAADVADHLVEVPAWGRGRTLPLQVLCDQRPELDRPTANGLVADLDATLASISSTSRKLRVKRK
jgi:hypothetical protein